MAYKLPTKSPFTHSVGICFHTNMCDWYPKLSGDNIRQQQIQDSQDRLAKVVKDFKLVRIYGFLTAGWLSTGTLDPCAEAFVNVIKADSTLEGVIATTDDTKDWFKTKANVDSWVSKLKSELGSSVSQIKTILICNEINSHGFTANDIKTIFDNFKGNPDFMALKIPLSVSFSNLPVQSGDSYSDGLVAAVMNNWDASWNDNNPYVFIDPYPDAAGINNAAGVFDWQSRVQEYYAKTYPSIQIFIAETGAEGATDDTASVPVIQSIIDQLDTQHKAAGTTVPTFLFEAVDEGLKGGNPIQSFMGVYKDAAAGSGSDISLKSGITLPSWL